jgi:blue light- and temperature-responsive anti-repressor
MTELYRLVYTSRNLLTGAEEVRAAAVAEILATSQKNNARVGVSGALLFNGGSFAQVLEGPRPVVERTFERIQRDPRHSDVNVLQCEPVAKRGFANWSMAFVGHSVRGQALWNEMAGRTGFDLARIEGETLFSTLHSIVLAEEDLQPEEAACAADTAHGVPLGATKTPPVAEAPVREALDVARLRAELQHARPEERQADGPRPAAAPSAPLRNGGDAATAAASPGTEAGVLRAALAEERARTTELRRNLDEARVALAGAQQHADTLRAQRDLWAGRAKALASALSAEPDLAQALDMPAMRSVA